MKGKTAYIHIFFFLILAMSLTGCAGSIKDVPKTDSQSSPPKWVGNWYYRDYSASNFEHFPSFFFWTFFGKRKAVFNFDRKQQLTLKIYDEASKDILFQFDGIIDSSHFDIELPEAINNYDSLNAMVRMNHSTYHSRILLKRPLPPPFAPNCGFLKLGDEIKIFNWEGRLVRNIWSRQTSFEDLSSICWDGKDNEGKTVPTKENYVAIWFKKGKLIRAQLMWLRFH